MLDELAAPTNAETRLDAAFLRLTGSRSVPDLEASARQMLDLLLAERATVERCAKEFDFRAKAIAFLGFRCGFGITPPNIRSTPAPPENARIVDQWIPEFERKWEESKPKVATNAAPSTSVGVASRLPTNAASAVVGRGTLARRTNFPAREDSGGSPRRNSRNALRRRGRRPERFPRPT